ncbi:hypothetical protein [uncultured Chryseobacterium sp.]|uniref:hypothetical protein n=1 Tax=uncultured Chryseobacterium sp. TaxID=259322 RepID=UPI0025F5F6E9|nr:hypothetical protein [uncultured Chryseobacterium sp.]
MNKKVSGIYVAIFEERVITIDTNLRKFYNALPTDVKSKRSYDYFSREFNKSLYFKFKFDNRYSLQKIELKKDNDVKGLEEKQNPQP